ncbi:hypothetical protein EV586_102647 [Tumebacillus sp. BK434]|uniref:restriction endonuclease-like protein n=1 Tax=Tumebacillus sp. BK434 TaxID=2512169 RepID=UPI001047F342|nr:restriction endonuclease-like protein [Tumebacillus sp. BK434]TCP58194.1 hypothetical protein EV586_102647 [Tumebacillus sp. BK434]
MDSPRSGSRRNHDETLLLVETNLFNLYLIGKPFHPTVEALQLHRDEDAWVDAAISVVPVSGRVEIEKKQLFSPMTGQLEDLDSHRALPCFYEHQGYEVLIEKNTDVQLEFYHQDHALRQTIKPRGRYTLSGVLNFRNEVGYTDFEIRLAGESVLKVQLEIFPSKMDYKKDYEAIRDDVNRQVHNLAFDFMRKTYSTAGVRNTQSQSLTEFFSLLRPHFDELVRAVERIEKMPHHRLEKDNRVVSADKVKRAGKENISYLSKRPHLLAKHDQGVIKIGAERYHPAKLIETKRRTSYDTAENRFVRWALTRILDRLKSLRNGVSGKSYNRRNGLSPAQKDKLGLIDRYQKQVDRLLRLDFLQEVGEMRHMSLTLVLQMAPGYRDVYRLYLLLTKGLSLQGDFYQMSLKDVAQLYEYWCFLKIHELLKAKYDLVSQNILRVDRKGVFVRLDKKRSASVTFRNPQNGERFTLFYNALPKGDISRNHPTLSQKPDNVFALKKHNSPIEYKYVFDAKYRLNPAYSGTDYQSWYKTPGPEEEDINTMHRYRDAILSEEGGSFERSMFGAYVLFPYHNEAEFAEHHFYKSIKKVNIGALPFLPNSTELMEQFLDDLINDTPEQAFERSLSQRGSAAYYTNKLSQE